MTIKWDWVGYSIFCRKYPSSLNLYLQIRLMVIGEYIHTLDEKNRLSLPAKFRKEMGKKLIIVPGFDKSLFLFTVAEWQKRSARLAESSMFQSNNRSVARFLFGRAVETDVDASGRILIPDLLKAHAGLKQKIALIGVHNRVELWDEKTWDTYKKQVEQNADALAEQLGAMDN